MKKKEEKLVKLSEYGQRLAVILIDEMQQWESTTAITIGEFNRVMKRLEKVKR